MSAGTYALKLLGGRVHDGLEVPWPANVLLPLALLIHQENGRIVPVQDPREAPTPAEAAKAGWDLYRLTRDQEINAGWPGAGATVLLDHQVPAPDAAPAAAAPVEPPPADLVPDPAAPPKVDVAPDVLEQLKAATPPAGSEGDAPASGEPPERIA